MLFNNSCVIATIAPNPFSWLDLIRQTHLAESSFVKMDMTEIPRSIILWIILACIKIYVTIVSAICIIFLPITKYLFSKVLKSMFGLTINGPNPTDPQVINERAFYSRGISECTLGLLESYVDQDWTTKDFFGFICTMFESQKLKSFAAPGSWILKKLNLQTAARIWSVGQDHYDMASPIICSMIDKNLQYTCGYWKNATDLDQAQLDKMDLIARKLMLKPGMRVLDIGCGYGSLCHYLAKNYGVTAVGCSVSEEQTRYAIDIAKKEKLDCEFVLCDYRDYGRSEHEEEFDRIVSVGMFEHVGFNNYPEYFKVCNNALKNDGIVLLHTIGVEDGTPTTEAWTNKYIFPYSALPYFSHISQAIKGKFLVEDWHNFGFDYYKTLCAWENNFDESWPKFEKEYGAKFYRMWKCYLQSAQAGFYTRTFQLWQITLVKKGLKGGYSSQR